MQPSIAPRTESARSKRSAIVTTAVDHFGRVGFEHTKWATIADEVGIGQTALYHYFESKSHCLLTIMHSELEASLERFHTTTEGVDDPEEALRRAVLSAYQGDARDALQRRILQSHMDLLSTKRPFQKEEEERRRARELVQSIENAWSGLIADGIERKAFAPGDPVVMARMVLALVVGVWRWYRPGGSLTLDEIGTITAEAALRIVRA